MIEAERGKEGLEESKKTGNNIGRPKLEKEKLLITLLIYDSDQYSIKEIINENLKQQRIKNTLCFFKLYYFMEGILLANLIYKYHSKIKTDSLTYRESVFSCPKCV